MIPSTSPSTSRLSVTAARPLPAAPATTRSPRNSFKELFEQSPAGLTEVRGDRPALPVARTTARLETTKPAPAATPETHAPDHPPEGPVPSIPDTDMSVYHRIAKPLALDPLMEALEQAGLAPGKFKFDQVESFENVPGHPELSYVNRQLLIRGPNGAKLFDLAWALRTPWVTAVELKTYGIA